MFSEVEVEIIKEGGVCLGLKFVFMTENSVLVMSSGLCGGLGMTVNALLVLVG